MKSKEWIYKEIDYNIADKLVKQYGLSPLASIIMQGRNELVGGDFNKLGKSAKECLYDPFLFEDMKVAVDRIKLAVNNNEKITVYGDYDADGITATAILCHYLKEIGANVDYYIPDRLDEGYGVNENAVEEIAKRGTNLIITVDTGITAFEEVYYAQDLGIDFIITDHHECRGEIPECVAVINPKRHNSTYPFHNLCGAGVAFKLVCALNGNNISPILKKYSSLAAIATVADVMPVTDENRAIIKFGMKYFNNCENKGVTAILNESDVNAETLDCNGLGFFVVPRINAAGRIGNAEDALHMFLSEDIYTASKFAKKLSEYNRQRQKLCNDIYFEAEEIINSNKLFENNIIIVANENWHPGVIGIVAAKVTQKYNKPSILLTIEGEIAHGSARSVEGINIFDALCGCENLLIKFGGHTQAAGISLFTDDINTFSDTINLYLKDNFLSTDTTPKLYIDYDLENKFINQDNIKSLDRLKPFGNGNPSPVFSVVNMTVKKIITLKDGLHLKMELERDGIYITALYFGKGGLADILNEGDIIDIAGGIELNAFMGKTTIQMILSDIKMG